MSKVSTAKVTKKRGGQKKLKDANAPKAPLTPYLKFGAQQRVVDPTINNLSVGKQGKMLSEMWKNLDEETKEKFKQEYVKEKEAHDKKVEEYKQTDDYKKFIEQKKSLGQFKEKKTKKQTSYNEYFKEQYPIIASQNKEFTMPEITSLVAKNWKALDDEGKKAYIERAKQSNEANAEKDGKKNEKTEKENIKVDSSEE